MSKLGHTDGRAGREGGESERKGEGREMDGGREEARKGEGGRELDR